MVNYAYIGRRISEIRSREDMTQEDLAEAAGVSFSYISRIENAVKKPSLEVLIRIANALGVTVDELLVGNLIYNPNDYQTDMDELMALCSQNEKRLAYEILNALISILHENGWKI